MRVFDDGMCTNNHSRAAQPASAPITVNIRAHSRRDTAAGRASRMRGGATFVTFRDVDRPASSTSEARSRSALTKLNGGKQAHSAAMQPNRPIDRFIARAPARAL